MRLQFLYLCSLPLLALTSTAEQTIFHEMSEAVEDYSPLISTQPTLADLLTIEPSVSIFYSYAREVSLSQRFVNDNARSTLLVPTNKAVMALARKPHQGPTPVDDTVISEQAFDEQSKDNVERWVSAHIIPKSPITLVSQSYDTLLRGKSITFEPLQGKTDDPEWSRVSFEDGARIVGMKEASNGVMYLIDSTVKVD